ncbi:MAG: SusD/RagB family nutrient-binding outer membrane lipoprotein [Bacteroidota bacterium]
MKKLIKKQLILLIAILIFGCSDSFLDINEDPNQSAIGVPSLLLTYAQANLGAELVSDIGFGGSVYARQRYGLAASTYAITGATYQSDWNSLYAGTLRDLNQVRQIGEETNNLGYVGISKVLSGYTFHVLVDYFGDIPFSEALNGEVNLSPVFEDDADVYDAILNLLDDAIVNLDSANAQDLFVDGDIMLGGDFDSWIEVANTLKLKMYLNISNVDAARARDGINEVLADGRIIDAVDEDFQLQFTSDQVPIGRHMWYQSEYDTGPGYLDNFLMLTLASLNDPRIRYYVYRQSTYDELDFQTTPCSGRTAEQCPTWTQLQALGLNYTGRDHGDPSGLPGDDDLVSVVGLYPSGGKYDDSSYRTVNGNSGVAANRGAEGAGISPIFTSSMTHFMLAEAALNIPGVTTPLTASEHFEAGMVDSFDKVREFALSSIEADEVNEFETDNGIDYEALADTYVAARLSQFDTASDDDRMNLLMTQKALASWGNGVEPYTDLRRTGFPLYPASLAPQGPFPVRVLLPDSEIAGNANAPSTRPSQAEPIFWDN